MIDAKTAKKNSDETIFSALSSLFVLNNSANQANLAVIESKIVEASNKGQYSVSIGEKCINETIITRLRELGYEVSKNSGYYDQRDPIEPYYVISWW